MSEEKALDAAIDSAIAERRLVGGVVLLARQGKVTFRRAFGLADRATAKPMREITIFRLASVTKPIVTAAALRMVEQGQISLDAPVTQWLPEFRPKLLDGSVPGITIHHLITHMSGLGYRFAEPPQSLYHLLNISDGLDQPGLAMSENLERLRAAPLAFPPGSAWRYSLGIDVLGAAMEVAAGASLPAIVADRVTTPLGLSDLGFEAQDPCRLATPYAAAIPEPIAMTDGTTVALDAGSVTFAPGRVHEARSFPSGGAGMVGTADDVLTFLEAIRRGGAPILDRSTVSAMCRNHVGSHADAHAPGAGFGYGWAVLLDPSAAGSPQSPGTLFWGGVYGHSWFIDPLKALTVVILTNTAFEGMNGRLVTDVRNAVYAG